MEIFQENFFGKYYWYELSQLGWDSVAPLGELHMCPLQLDGSSGLVCGSHLEHRRQEQSWLAALVRE